ncbi:MAG TPA: BatA domain-containing protein [Gemmatimonadales bacterium]|nr:BatA domain-containing protein [Gemmatimonadales bacterium]
MSFIHPLALLGLTAAAIPALLHLLQRRIPPELDFPAVRYLSAAERESARRLKLRHLLLLILRTALIVAIVFAAARPLVSLRGAGVSGGAHEPTAVVVILDNSPSSGAVVDGGVMLERLRAAAQSSVRHTTSADRVWLMLCDGVLRGGTREALLATIDSTRAGWQGLDLVQAVERAARLVNAQPSPGREVHLLSDMQATAVASGRADVPRGVRVLALAPGHAVANRGIAAVTVSEGAAVIELSGSTAGDGSTPQPVPVTIRLGGGGGRRGGEITARGLATPGSDRAGTGTGGRGGGGGGASRATVTVSLPAQSLAPGWWLGEAALEPDELRADDRRPFAWRVSPPARVMATAGAGAFVAAALDVLRDGRRVSDGRDVVISGADGPSGNRAIIQPPADPALIGQANRALAARGVPWRWDQLGTPGVMASPELALIDGAAVARRYRLEGGSEDVLATVNGEPWLVRSGSVVLLGSRLDTAWTALPAAPGFVPFVDALVNRIVVGETQVAAHEGAPRVEFQTRGADTIGATAFGPDARESDLTPATTSRAIAALGGADRVAILSVDRLAAERFSGARRVDASWILLVLALLLAAAELGVATRTR